ncbi:Mammalian cell entry related domain protein [Psychromonas ingrahamii 37]|uniref:Mammalian cell entry related domain protein n=1 Tax=Psychromonas ingrahamii (strain DSM 17664 / CCUG 51855 / 37) TaxID=357804 RepID=A1SWU9_PSYIN|nr:MlaD family protein [Psychromonas ingrahamii]ABM03964.1 Mammalian cell entry related domain protein [Psychromonas ingrahamii 37]
MNEQDSMTEATILKSQTISPIWFLPAVAALLGAWFLFQNITHANTTIKIHFEHAESIIVDKTKLHYKGVIIGTVKKVELDATSGVNIIAEIESHAKFMLRKNTKFWLVSPKASLTSITGLDTLFSGSYINLQRGEGEYTTNFIAQTEQPINIPENARLINLQSDNADSINVGTPLFYRNIKVGEVAAIRLEQSGKTVNISAFVDGEYKHLVKNNSKFWNISGLSANVSPAGIDISLNSITSLIAGGITFSSPEDGETLKNEAQFQLFNNIDDSKTGLSIELITNKINNLPNGAGILFKGFGIGRITDIQYSIKDQQFVVSALINPQFSELITDGSQFWIEQTSFTFAKIKNIGNVIKGDYIAFQPVEKNQLSHRKKSTRFLIQQAAPAKASVLSLLVLTEDATGLNPEAPITYQGLKIGKITALDFSEKAGFIAVHIDIDQQYHYLINKNSQFYLLNGVNFNASLKGIEVQSTPLENLISGGIGLYNKKPVNQSHTVAFLNKDQLFRLYPSKALVKMGLNVFSQPGIVHLLSRELPSVSEGSPVYYRKLPIGEVSGFSIDNSGLMQTTLSIKGQYKHLINDQSVFWNISGFSAEAGLSGLKIQAESLLAIAAGGIAVGPGHREIDNKHSNGKYKLFNNQKQATTPTTLISLTFNQAKDLQTGSPLRLKGLVVGEVTNLTLTSQQKVQATVNLKPEFAKQVARKGSRFWMVTSTASLSGVKNLSTLVTGAYINVSPGEGISEKHFSGEDSEPLIGPNQSGLRLILVADNAGSSDISSPVYHRQIQIGQVISKRLSYNSSGVEITVNITPKYAHLIRQNSIFWPASGFNLEFGITGAALKATSLTSLIKGGISMSTPDNQPLQPASDPLSRFQLENEIQEEWLNWRLAIPRP